MKVKEMVVTPSGTKIWKTKSYRGYGATVIHDRHSLDDLATESRAIIIYTTFKEGDFIDPPKGLSLPIFKLGAVPSWFNLSGRAFDTWKPLLMVANGVGDEDWLMCAYMQIVEATDSLKDGHAYEENQSIFAQVIKAYCDNSGMGLMVKQGQGLTLQSSVVEPLKKDMPYITARTVAKTLTKLGLKVIRHSGTNKLFTTEKELAKVAKEISYEDEVFRK